jgi:DNA-binding transcriptional MerR regulator
LYTLDTALDALKKYNIDENTLATWEFELSLDIPVDAYGRKQYSPHHVNLFKNIKKHIALGRTIAEIRAIVSLPPIETSKPVFKSGSGVTSVSSYGEVKKQIVRQSTISEQAEQSSAVPEESGIALSPCIPLTPDLVEQPGNLMTTRHEDSTDLVATSSSSRLVDTTTLAASADKLPKSTYASVPSAKPALNYAVPATESSVSTESKGANVIHLVQRLNDEKDQLYKKLIETEKLNSHLYSANNLYNKKVREMTAQMKQLKETYNENEKFQLMDDKAKLHKQLIDAEKLSQYKQEEILNQKLQNEALKQDINTLNNRLSLLQKPFEAHRFCGDWMENGALVEIVYDNFGINIEPERTRLFRIAEPPERLYGQNACIHTVYQYESNPLWKRHETLVMAYLDEKFLKGEVTVEYILDGVPVAKALYQMTCTRQAISV